MVAPAFLSDSFNVIPSHLVLSFGSRLPVMFLAR